MVALIGDQLARVFRGRGRGDRRQVGRGCLECVRQGRGVALVGGVDLGRDDGTGVEVDCMLRLVGEARAPVLELKSQARELATLIPNLTQACEMLRVHGPFVTT